MMTMNLASVSFDLARIDPFAIIAASVGYIVVFTALVLLYYIYLFLPKLIQLNIRKKLRRQGKHNHTQEDVHIPGEVSAAIAMALQLHFGTRHDDESNVMTIKKVSKRYSPWSSKLYGMNTYQK